MGKEEVYVQSFPVSGGKYQISSGGGTRPIWAPDGKELYFIKNDKMMAVSVDTDPTLRWSAPRKLFDIPLAWDSTGYKSYDVGSKGDRFLIVAFGEGEPNLRQIHIVLNWFDELERLVPTGK